MPVVMRSYCYVRSVFRPPFSRLFLLCYFARAKCDLHAQDDERGDLCCRDSSIGECKGSLCPRLEEVPLRYRGFGEQPELDYPKGYVKVPHDASL
jgi:hypothetical protein